MFPAKGQLMRMDTRARWYVLATALVWLGLIPGRSGAS
jgi:hypothetical protein